MSTLNSYICKNCGTMRYCTEQEIQNKSCQCNYEDFIPLNINPVEYDKLTETEKVILIKKSLNLNDEEYEQQKEKWYIVQEPIRQKEEEKRRKWIEEKEKSKVHCPYCNSTNIAKIGTLKRAVSVGVFRLTSKKIGKQWHCNHCKSDF
ncbi:MAG: hypothetical protein NC253_14710 [Ruminococcus sp.]|nr:hypothetical protein [Ruminococcus sp.]